MARLNVYLPDQLAQEARQAGLNVSSLAQEAIRRALAARATDRWIETLRPVPPHRATHESVLAAIDAARDDPPTRHG